MPKLLIENEFVDRMPKVISPNHTCSNDYAVVVYYSSAPAHVGTATSRQLSPL